MDSLNHYNNRPGAGDEDQRRHVWSEDVAAPPSLLSGVLDRLGLEQKQNRARSELIHALHHPAWHVRVGAVQELGKLCDVSLLELLESAWRDEHVSVRAAAVYALGQLGIHAPIHLLVQSLQDPEWQVREKAVLALAEQGAQAPLELVQAALYDPDMIVREAAHYALQQIQAYAPVAATDAMPVTQEANEEHRLVQQLSTYKPNILKNILNHIWPAWEGQGESTMLQTPNDTSPTNRLPERSRRSKGRVLATGIALVATILLVFSWVVILQQRHLPGTTTAHQPTATHTPTRAPSPTVTPSPTETFVNPSVTTLYTYHSSYRIVSSVSWLPDGKRLVMVDNAVKSWDATTGNHIVTYPVTSHFDLVTQSRAPDVFYVAWSPNGRFIVGTGGLKLQLWNAASGQSLGSYTPKAQAGRVPAVEHGDLISSATWSPDSSLVAFLVGGDAYGFSLQVWNVQTRQLAVSIPNNPGESMHSFRWSADSKSFAFIDQNGIQTYNVATGVTTRTLMRQNPGGAVAWSPDGTKIASADDRNGAILVWDSATGKTLSRMQYQDPSGGLTTVGTIAWSPDGKHIAFTAGLMPITEWEVSSGKKVLEYTRHVVNGGNGPTDLAWSPDGKMIASASGGESGPATVQVWIPVQ